MSTIEKEICPNCGAKIKSTLLTDNLLLSEGKVKLINRFTDNKSTGFCQKCSSDLLEEGAKVIRVEKELLKKNLKLKFEELNIVIQKVPIITLHNPKDWKYETLEIVSAQSVTGTGVFSEIASNWTDFFGMDSKIYNEKLKSGEDKCKNQLRAQTIKLGGNAILGTDIDYSEAGAGKGMLMVCMAGTAIKINNLNELNYDTNSLIRAESLLIEIQHSENELKELVGFEKMISY